MEQRGPSGAVRPGALSALLAEIVRCPPDGSGWLRSLKPGAVVGRFDLVKEIGRGGFGVVWEAKDRELRRAVAFKAVFAGRPDLCEERLLSEAEAAARLSHPNIVTLFDVGRTEDGPYLVLELLRGETLAKRLEQGPLSVREALRIAVEIAKGLAHAHAHGVVHRDLTPGNVFLCEDEQVKVLDLGMAHAFGHRKLDGGTPPYMAPEQVEGAPEDERTDVFALGAVLYRMLTGDEPYRDLAHRHWKSPPELDVGDAPALGGLLHAMLAPRPTDRPRDAGEVLTALSAIARDLDRGRAAALPVKRRTRARVRLAALVALGVALGVLTSSAVTRWRAGRDATPATKTASIAVLPFADLSPQHDHEYFSDGLSEEMIDRLSRSPDLRVIARTSSFQFKGRNEDIRSIARTLGVAHLLEGSVRKAGNDVRITAQLIRASDGTHVWSQTYDRKLSDIFEVQDDIAGTVARALNAALRSGATSGAQPRAPSKEAYNQVLLGTYFFNRQAAGDDERAYNAFLEATRIDPDYAVAWAKLARATDKDTPERRAKALAAVQRALSLDPNLAYAHYVLGRQLFYSEWEWARARVELARAIELDPDYLPARVDYAYLTEGMFGHLDRKIEYLRQIISNDPLDAFSLQHLATTLLLAGRFEEAAATMQRLLALNPAWPGGYANHAKSLLLAGRSREALTAALKESDEGEKQCALALVHWSLGHRLESDAALAWLERKERENPGVVLDGLVQVHAYRGERNAAFELLDRAFDVLQSRWFMTLITVDPFLRDLHGDPRYAALLVKLKLDRRTAEAGR